MDLPHIQDVAGGSRALHLELVANKLLATFGGWIGFGALRVSLWMLRLETCFLVIVFGI